LNTFFSIFVITFGWVQQQTHWVQQQTHPKVMTNMLKKVFNWSDVHLSEVTSYKIYTLVVKCMYHIKYLHGISTIISTATWPPR
jgi:hypothetical protein